jgi:hypothetical protein
MESTINKWIFLLLTTFISLNVIGVDDPNLSKKKQREFKFDIKTPLKSFFKKKLSDDTLVFDKSYEDTLIFAEDEKKCIDDSGISPRQGNGNSHDVLNKREKPALLTTKIYPNPSVGETWLMVNSEDTNTSELTITGLDGKLVLSETFTGKVYLIKDIAPGVYIVTVKNGKETVQKRLFVK